MQLFEGLSVSSTWNGQLALQQLAGFSGVVILDLRMPIMSGWEVTEALREDGRLPSIPIAICTSSPENALVVCQSSQSGSISDRCSGSSAA